MALDTVATVQKELSKHADVSLAFVYGSVAAGTEHAGSDVDVAVAGAAVFDAERLIELSLTLGKACRREVQIRDLRRLKGLILSEVLQKGIVVKGDSRLHARFLMHMLDYQEDLLPTVRKIRAAQLERFINGQGSY